MRGSCSGTSSLPSCFDGDIGSDLHDQMLEIFPTLADVKITNAWSGLMAFTADYLPKLGVRDRVHYVLGCNGGSGVVLMPWLGRAVGRRIAGTDDPTQPMSSLAGIPYERQPLGEHTSKLVAAAGVWYGYEIGSTPFGRDRLGPVSDAPSGFGTVESPPHFGSLT